MKGKYGINIYDKIFELRKFEIENFWKRTLFFWGTIAIIYAGYFNADFENFQIIIPLIGLLFNIIFSLSTRGSKYWQEHWESIAEIYENELDFELFTTRASGLMNQNNKSFFTKPYRFSVSKLTMLLSDISVLIWLILWIREIINLLFNDILSSTIHWLTLGIISIHVILIGYYIVFIIKGNVYHGFDE